ncbi:MAG: hypothetical protein H5T59_11875 [Anaerolineae bacterium]|nr:hypothetical protein [Anaerolineae bacterium]
MLSIQLDLLQWYLERGQAVQATILAREWLVSYVAWKIGKDLVRERESVEDLLNDGVRAQEQHSPLPSLISQLPNAGEIVKTWGWLRDLRNDVCHMGMRKQPRKTKTILGDVDTLHSRLLGLWQASPTQVTQGD